MKAEESRERGDENFVALAYYVLREHPDLIGLGVDGVDGKPPK
jgi:hypothetical protein